MDTVLKEKTYTIKPLKKLTVGDPMYLDEINNGTATKGMKKLVVDTSVRCCKYGKAKLSLIESTEDGFTWQQLVLKIGSGSKPIMPDAYLNGQWFGKNTVKEEKDLGCDTARFYLSINDKDFGEIPTGGDGYFGFFRKYKEYYGAEIELAFDTDWHDWNEIEDMIRQLQ